MLNSLHKYYDRLWLRLNGFLSICEPNNQVPQVICLQDSLNRLDPCKIHFVQEIKEADFIKRLDFFGTIEWINLRYQSALLPLLGYEQIEALIGGVHSAFAALFCRNISEADSPSVFRRSLWEGLSLWTSTQKLSKGWWV